MKSFKMVASLLIAAVLLASCSLIPPQGIGPDALGLNGRQVTVGIAPAALGFSQLGSASRTFDFQMTDIQPPNLPIAPSSLQAVQGFTATVDATAADLPQTITITNGSLEITVEDNSGGPDPVEASVSFGPITLNKAENCTGSNCEYAFSDPAAAARSLTMTVGGDDFSRLLRIITEGQDNTVGVTLFIDTAEDIASLTFTITVENNYIRF